MESSKSISILRIAGIPIEINYSWILIFILVTANLALSWFPRVLPERTVIFYYVLGAAGAILLFACVLAHELSHSLVAKRGGLEVRGIILHVFGGVSLISEKNYSAGLELRVALAGPLLSILLGVLFWAARKLLDPLGAMFHLFTYLYSINIMLALFNLLPGFPLDGGRVLRSLIAFWKKDLVISTKIATRAGVVFSYLLMAYGVVVILNGNFWGIWTVLIGIFLKDAAETSYKQVLMQSTLKDLSVRELMQQNPVLIPKDITIQALIDNYFWRYHYGSFPVASDERAEGIVTFTDVKKVAADARDQILVKDIMHEATEALITHPEEPIMNAFQKASTNGVGRLIVVDDVQKVVGYISLRDIARALSLRQ